VRNSHYLPPLQHNLPTYHPYNTTYLPTTPTTQPTYLPPLQHNLPTYHPYNTTYLPTTPTTQPTYLPPLQHNLPTYHPYNTTYLPTTPTTQPTYLPPLQHNLPTYLPPLQHNLPTYHPYNTTYLPTTPTTQPTYLPPLQHNLPTYHPYKTTYRSLAIAARYCFFRGCARPHFTRGYGTCCRRLACRAHLRPRWMRPPVTRHTNFLTTHLALVRVRGSCVEVCWWGHDLPIIACGQLLPIIATFLRRAARIAATPPSLPLLLPLPACTTIKKKTSEQME
jgi:hypothetical protein